ncbi:hypothetical protein HY633_02355 [Candidatus Uhrbacteria bacterium]|nr:hypothetical protein [Candidatus Uhrbacteria bacterium]
MPRKPTKPKRSNAPQRKPTKPVVIPPDVIPFIPPAHIIEEEEERKRKEREDKRPHVPSPLPPGQPDPYERPPDAPPEDPMKFTMVL